jgi:hypothetical protein
MNGAASYVPLERAPLAVLIQVLAIAGQVTDQDPPILQDLAIIAGLTALDKITAHLPLLHMGVHIAGPAAMAPARQHPRLSRGHAL